MGSKATCSAKHLFVLSFLLTIFSISAVWGSNTDSLKYLGHSSVKIKTQDGLVIYIDPYQGTDYADSADVVLVSHQHYDHNAVSLVTRKKTCTVISNYEAIQSGAFQTFTVRGIGIESVPAYNSNHSKSSCVGYVLTLKSGVKIYHAGDTGNISEFSNLAAKSLTYALLPMDPTYTMTPEVATTAAGTINAKYTIPIHTMSPPDTYSDAIVARFTAPNKLIVRPGQTIGLIVNATSVGNNLALTDNFSLAQNYPNPFNPSTLIRYHLPMSCFVNLSVFNVIGQKIATLVNEFKDTGEYITELKTQKLSMASGIYFYTLKAGDFLSTRKMILMK